MRYVFGIIILGALCAARLQADQITSGGVFFPGTQVHVGSDGFGSGTLTLNAEMAINGITDLSGSSLFQVDGDGGTSTLNLIGDGTAGSASIQTELAWFGVGQGTAVVNIEAGGDFVTSNLLIQPPGTNNETGTAQVHVNGPNSRLQTEFLSLSLDSFDEPPAGGFGSILVDGGALLDLVSTPPSGLGAPFVTGGFADIGSNIYGGADGLLTASGADSMVRFTRFLNVGSSSAGGLVVENGARVTQVENPGEIDDFLAIIGETETSTLTIGSAIDTATVRVAGSGSAIEITRNIQIGQASTFLNTDADSNPIFGSTNGTIIVEDNGLLSTPDRVLVSETDSTGSGTLTVRNGGMVEAESVEIYEGGTLNGDSGTITGDVFNHGLVSPGASPGVMTIDGDYTQGADGSLLIEIAGTTVGTDYDQFIITGNATLDGTLILSFIEGFTPDNGDSFDFLLVAGTFNDNLLDIQIDNLPNNFDTEIDFNSGRFSVTVIPTPTAAPVIGFLFSVLLLSRRRIAGRHRRSN